MVFDMLFLLSSHSLAESIYLLDNNCKQLSEGERIQVKERINPELRFASQLLGSICVVEIFFHYIFLTFLIIPTLYGTESGKQSRNKIIRLTL